MSAFCIKNVICVAVLLRFLVHAPRSECVPLEYRHKEVDSDINNTGTSAFSIISHNGLFFLFFF